MTPLFPKLFVAQFVFIAIAVAAGVGGYVAAGSATLLIGGILAAIFIFCGVQMGAVVYHQKLVNHLTKDMAPDAFIAAYEYLLKQSENKPTYNCTVRNYLSTGYMAKGDFDTAKKLLEESPVVEGSQKARGDAIRYSNLCNLCIAKEDLTGADDYLRKLQAILDEEGVQGAGRQAEGDVRVLKNGIHLLRGWDIDEPLLKALATSGTAYHRMVSTYQLGMFHENKHDFEAAAKCYKLVAQSAPKLYVAKRSAQRLKALEERTGEVY